MKLNKGVILIRLIAFALVFAFGYWTGRVLTQFGEVPMEKGSFQIGVSYVIFKDGALIKARNQWGHVEFSDANVTLVVQSAINSLPDGGAILLNEIRKPANITIPANVIIIENHQGKWTAYPRMRQAVFEDDFLRASLGSDWSQEVNGTGGIRIQNSASGVVRLVTGTNASSVAAIFNGGASYLFYDPTLKLVLEERIRLPGALTGLTAWFGFSTLDGLNHIIFSARPDVSPNFRAEVMKDNVTYGVNTDVPLDNSWHTFRIEVNKTEVRFYIDDVLKAVISQVPTTSMCLEYCIKNSVSASRELDIDWVHVEQTRQ